MIPKPRSTNNSEMEADEGMQQPVVLRGLLQCVAISLFFTVRYMLDVLFTPRLVQALFWWLSNCARCIWRWLWCVPVASFLALHLWGSLTCDTVVRGLLMWYTLRAGLVAFMDDQVVVGGLKKHHIWLPLLWWVTFTRVSSGRGTRARSPSVRVEFLSTLSGKTLDLMLPSMRKDFVKIEDVRRVLPVPSAPPQGTASTCLVVQTDEQGQKRKGDDPEPASQDHANDNDDVVIDRDLMCSLCQSPEDDANMLVCDCKRGFHIYCISPPLDAVPEGEWKCPICTEAAAQPDMI